MTLEYLYIYVCEYVLCGILIRGYFIVFYRVKKNASLNCHLSFRSTNSAV